MIFHPHFINYFQGPYLSFSAGCVYLQISITDISETVPEPQQKVFFSSHKAGDRESFLRFCISQALNPLAQILEKLPGKHLLNYTKGKWFRPLHEQGLQPGCPGTILPCKGEMI